MKLAGCLVLVAWLSEPVRAEDATALRSDLTLRLDLPFSGLIVQGGTGYWSMGGGSVSVGFFRMAELEVGAQAISNPCADGYVVTGRAGLAPTLWARRSGKGWRIRLPFLGSLQAVRASGDGCDGHEEDRATLLTLVSGLDATYANGLTVRLLGFAGPSVAAGTSMVLGGSLDFGWRFGM